MESIANLADLQHQNSWSQGQNVATAERGDLTVRTFRGRPRHDGFSRKLSMDSLTWKPFLLNSTAPLQCRSGKGKWITSLVIYTWVYDGLKLFQQPSNKVELINNCTLVCVGSIS